MNKEIKGLILESVTEVLLEGRLEDVKAKYDDTHSDTIDKLSKADPSGNNKYLAWMANQYLVVGDSDFNTLTDVVKRYHSNLTRINNKMSKEVVESNPNLYPGRETRRVSNNPKDINSFGSVDSLTKIVEAAEENQPTSTERDRIYQDDKWTVIVPKTHKASCKYGVHSAWCVSTSNDHYYKDYTSRGMLAFILWRGKQEGEMEMDRAGEYKVAVYIRYDQSSFNRWEWYNKKDSRMDPDLAISVFPPAMIETIKEHLKTHMKSIGYYTEIDVDELREKSHMLVEDENNKSYTFIPKKEYGLEWVTEKYKANTRFYGAESAIKKLNFEEYLPILRVSGEQGLLDSISIHLASMYQALTRRNYWNNQPKYNKFKNNISYELRRGNLNEDKLQELWEYFKTYFVENFNGYLNVSTSTLRIGDEVRWERKPKREQRRLGSKVGTIIRQTPSGYFVVDVGEDKPSRFKPNPDKYMDKKFSYENLDVDGLFEDEED